MQQAGKDAPPAHDDSIAAPGVFQLVTVSIPRNDGVQPGDGIARNAQVVIAAAANGGEVPEWKAMFLFLEFINERGHGKLSGSSHT